MTDFWSTYRNKHQGRECLILGNGESLFDLAHAGDCTPVYSRIEQAQDAGAVVIGLNQSWKMHKAPDYHVCVDISQYDRDEKQADVFGKDANKKAFQALSERGILFASPVWRDRTPPLGIPIPMLGHPYTWGRFDSDPRGLVVSVDGAGSVAYVALQLAELMGFAKIWLCGFDQQGPKFTGETVRSGILKRQDWLFKHTPSSVVKKTRVIAPSATTAFEIVEGWPW